MVLVPLEALSALVFLGFEPILDSDYFVEVTDYLVCARLQLEQHGEAFDYQRY